MKDYSNQAIKILNHRRDFRRISFRKGLFDKANPLYLNWFVEPGTIRINYKFVSCIFYFEDRKYTWI